MTPSRIEIYTDGSNYSVEKSAGCGVVCLYFDYEDNLLQTFANGYFIGDATNSVAELKAVEFGLAEAWVYNHLPIVLHTDSQYCVKLLTKLNALYGQMWENQAHCHIELVTRIRKLVERYRDLKIKWCRGHAGHKWNEKAHELASLARKLRKDGTIEQLSLSPV